MAVINREDDKIYQKYLKLQQKCCESSQALRGIIKYDVDMDLDLLNKTDTNLYTRYRAAREKCIAASGIMREVIENEFKITQALDLLENSFRDVRIYDTDYVYYLSKCTSARDASLYTIIAYIMQSDLRIAVDDLKGAIELVELGNANIYICNWEIADIISNIYEWANEERPIRIIGSIDY